MKKRRRIFGRICSAMLSFLMVLLSVFNLYTPVVHAAGTSTITQGKQIMYSWYPPDSLGYSTHVYTYNGNYAYCIESEKGSVPTGTYDGGTEHADMPLLACVLAMGPGGPLYNEMKTFWSDVYGITLTDDQAYLYTHVCANYAYQCSKGSTAQLIWKGYNASTAEAFFSGYLWYCADVAAGVVAVPSGKVYKNFTCTIVDTGANTQNVGIFGSCEEVTLQPPEMKITIPVVKSGDSSDPQASVDGAKYGLFRASDDGMIAEITLSVDPSDPTIATGSFDNINITSSGKYYVKETEAPAGFQKMEDKYTFTVDVADHKLFSDCNEITVTSPRVASLGVIEMPESMQASILIKKKGVWTAATSQPSLDGAVYGLYNDKDTLLTTATTSGETGGISTCQFILLTKEADYYIKEITPPTGWAADPDEYWFHANPTGASDKKGEITATKNANKFTFITERSVEIESTETEDAPGSFAFYKVSSTGDNLQGAVFEAYVKSSLTKDAQGNWDFTNGTLYKTYTSTASGFVGDVNVPAGTYIFHESVTPAGHKPIKDLELTITANKRTVIDEWWIDSETKWVNPKTGVTQYEVVDMSADLGSLKIKKNFGGTTVPTDAANKTYTFTVTGPNNYSKTVKITGDGEETLENLEYGTYTITEDQNTAKIDGYKLTVDKPSETVSIDSSTLKTVEITNTWEKLSASLKIVKTLGANAPTAAATKKYTFTVAGPGTYNKTVTITGAGEQTLTGLEFGTYTITEDEDSAKIDGYQLDVTDNHKQIVISAEQVYEAEITNTYTELGSLKITKVIDGNAPTSASTKIYKFTVTGPNGYSKNVEIEGAKSETLTGLEPGSYTVTEDTDAAKIDGYKVTVTGSGNTHTVALATLTEAEVTNTYQELGKLRIQKALNANAPAVATTKTYYFDITGPNNYKNRVGVVGGTTKLIEGLEPGEYTVKEDVDSAQIPNYSIVVEADKTATVSLDATAEVMFTNSYTQDFGKLTVVKQLDANAPSAATTKKFHFVVTGPGTYSNEFDITGAGTHTLTDLPYGEYTVTETEDSAKITDYTVTITGNGQKININSTTGQTLTIKNEYTEIPGTLLLYKTISGDITKDEIDGKLVFKVTAPSGTVTNYTVGKNNFLWNSTNNRYELTINPAEKGTYTIEETTTTKDGFDVTVSYKVNAGQSQTGAIASADVQINKETTVEFDNKYDTRMGTIKIVKQIEGKITPQDLDTLTFTITPKGGSTPVKTLTIKDDFNKVGDNYESDDITIEKGDYTVTETVTYGTKVYTVTYQIDAGSWNDGSSAAATVTPKNLTKITFKNKYELGSIKIVKKLGPNAPTAASSKKYNFTITGPNNVVKTASITGEGTAIITDLEMGTYEVKEDFEGAKIDGYNIVVSGEDSNVIVAENDKNKTVEITNTYTEVKTGSITLYKEGESVTGFTNGAFVWENKPIPGAAFDVFATEQIKDFYGVVIFEKDEKVGTITTGTDGKATLGNLPLGKYYAKETSAPDGYIIDSTAIDFELKDNTTGQAIVDTKTAFNERKKVALDMKKVDKKNQDPLSGAEVTIYAAEDIKAYDGTVIVTKGTAIETKTSAADGKIAFTVDLPVGSYTVKETKAPDLYNLDSTPIDFTFEKTQTENLRTITYNFENNEIKAQIVVVKKGESLTKYENDQFVYEERSLQGAEFDLRKKGETTVLGHYTTDANGSLTITDLDAGLYTLTETKAPYGMKLDTTPYEVEAKVYPNGTIIPATTLVNTRQKIVFNMVKVDANNTSKTLSGGQFDLYAAEDIKAYDGTVIVKKDTKLESSTAKNGKVAFTKDYPHAKYYIKEEKAPNGYNRLVEKMDVNCSYSDQTLTIMEVVIVCKNSTPPAPPTTPPTPPTTPPTTPTPPTNYRTGDFGQGGYSVLIREGATTKTTPAWPFAVGGCGLLLIGAASALLIRKKAKANKK